MSDLETTVDASSSPVSFLRELIRIPSPPGGEGDVARRVAAEMRRLGYDDVSVDGAGNVVGAFHGADGAPSLMFVTHLDHVDVGDPDRWPHPPFGGELHEGRVWGRGAVDIKGPLAAQVYGVGRLASRGGPPAGDVYVAAVVEEEIGGLGARQLAGRLRTDLAVVGEPSSNRLRRGHRGRAELEVRVRGRSAHASVPDRGVNPLFGVAAFLERLATLEMPSHPELGPATVAPTLLRTDQQSANVIPSEAVLTLDCRLVPGLTADEVREAAQGLLEGACRDGAEGEVRIPRPRRAAYTGLEVELPAETPAFLLPAGHPALVSAGAVLADILGAAPEVGVWGFATDGGHFASAGVTVVGFGLGRGELAHTVEESVEVAELEAAVEAYEALARRWPRAYARVMEEGAPD